MVAAALVCSAFVAGSASSEPPPAFRGSIERIDDRVAKRMTGVSWRPGCPVHLRGLRLLRLSYWGFDGRARTGALIVHRDADRELVQVFRDLYAARFPIRRMVPVDALAGRPMDQSYVRHLLPRLARKAGIERRVHAHGLRHAFAVDLVRSGAPLYVVRDALGHSSVATTDVYLSRVGAHEAVEAMRGREWSPE